VLRRKSPRRVVFSAFDRMVFAGLYALVPSILDALQIVNPNTVIRWHRAGGELLKLGIEVGQTSVAKYMAKRRRPPSQGWKTFLYNHADGIASMDLFVVPTISFRLLYGLLILQHARRDLLWVGVTAHPTAEWIARQFTEAYGWRDAPHYLVRNRDRVYGSEFIRRIRAMGIRDRPISAHSPWQNGYAERLIGSIRREYLDHVVVFSERHLANLLRSYQKYYNECRTHLSLGKARANAVHRVSAVRGNSIARANMAIMYMFGFQTVLDPEYGAKLLGEAIQGGVNPEAATFLLSNGIKLLRITDFAEIIKTIHVESTKGSDIA
jgi:transposase InsO family protein